jgi:uncharacterized membrane protein YfcA
MKQLLDFVIGLAAGILSGFGIGGGSLLILYLVFVLEMPQFAAAGVNLLYFLFCAPPALVSHLKNRLIDLRTAAVCIVAGIPSSLAAALVAAQVDVNVLRRVFGVFLLFIGLRELFSKK